MRKSDLVLVILCLIAYCFSPLLQSCNSEYKKSKEEKVFYYNPDSEDDQIKANIYFASHTRKVEYEGHRYLFFRDSWVDESDRTASVIHDPNCPTCLGHRTVEESLTIIEK